MTDYRTAGVDLAAAGDHIGRIGPAVTATWSENVVGRFGDFATGVRIPPGLERPVLMMTTDGVGTKLDLARRTGRWEGVGHDLVAMSVDDLAVSGARPLAFVDYMAVGRLDPGRDAVIVESIAEACAMAGCPLIGGETAEHPGVMDDDAVDLAGTALGIAGEDAILGPDQVEGGEVVVGLRSPNLRSNGFSLVRHVFDGVDLDAPFPTEDVSIGEVLMRPSVLYAPAILAAVATGKVRAAAHVTGGGLVANLDRSIPAGCAAVIDHWSWEWPQVFVEVQRRGGISVEEMRTTFNLGIGFCLIVPPDSVDEVAETVAAHDPLVIGRVDRT